jgi:hypothetical protein
MVLLFNVDEMFNLEIIMAQDIDALLSKMWNDYVDLNPQAQKIVNLLIEQGESVINDHIALRTFNHPRVCVDVIARPFLDCGYEEKKNYDFEEKKLKAKHYEHANPKMPKIFISELLLENFSEEFQQIVNKIIDQLSDEAISSFDFTSMGRIWDVSSIDYEKLKAESEYGAWVAAIGYRPNHFTVFINELKNFSNLASLNTFLKENGFKLNDSGGEIKGSPEVCLEQSSTLADTVEIKFSDKKLTIPSCYFEFAKRYPLADGSLYQGFVAKSADKIFESTDQSQ